MFIRVIPALVVLSQLVRAQTATPPAIPLPPPMPVAWPPANENHQISGDLLNDPLVATALAYVNAVVPQEVLSIAPSTFIKDSRTTYDKVAAVTNCYWPQGLCVRNADTATYLADVTACPGANQWGLTYDDGPIVASAADATTHPDSTDLRAKLKSYGKLATFFVVGSNGIQWPEEILAQHQDGHQLGIHTWSHRPSTTLTNQELVAEIKYTEAIIYNATGLLPTMWRPPYGDIDDRVRAVAHALGLRTVVWTDSDGGPNRDDGAADATEQTPAAHDKAVAAVKSWFTPQPGFISLSHDIDSFTTQVDLDSLDAMNAMGAAFPLQMQPVGTCMNLPFYRNVNSTVAPPVQNATSSLSSSTIASATTIASAPPARQTAVNANPPAAAAPSAPSGTPVSDTVHSGAMTGAEMRRSVAAAAVLVMIAGLAL
ncbi:chitin deacetylase [Thoreauomyces humboldtii]|nr:chitin deacetylase [Thoreauomyces humboldtii]